MRAKFIKPLNPGNWARFFTTDIAQATPFMITQRKLYILPTGAGVFFGVLLLVMLLGAINYNNSLGFMLTFLLAGLNIMSILHTCRNLLHLKVSIRAIAPVFAGERAVVPVLLDNPGGAPRFSVNLHFPGETPRACDIAADHWTQVELPLSCSSRGLHPLARLKIYSVFPLGLFRAWTYVRFDTAYLVYPRPGKRTGLPPDIFFQPKQTGDKGRGADDFAGLRGYHHGDSLRHIHWKTVAKEQGLHTKQFGGDRSNELWLDWQTVEHLDKEERIAQLTRWVIDAEQAGLSYGLRLPQTEYSPGQGDAHKHTCLQALALLD